MSVEAASMPAGWRPDPLSKIWFRTKDGAGKHPPTMSFTLNNAPDTAHRHGARTFEHP